MNVRLIAPLTKCLISVILLLQVPFATAQSGTGAKPPTVVATPYVKAELLAYAPEGVQAGKPLWLGLQLQHKPEWHTYWKNPGDSGLPTRLTWKLPAGLEAAPIDWPTPKKIPVGPLANYGYEGTVLLTVPVTVQNNFVVSGNDITVSLKAEWLVCKTECIPEQGEFTLKLPVQGSYAISRGLFESTRNALPQFHKGTATVAPKDKGVGLSIQSLPASWVGKTLEAFPEDANLIEPAAKLEQSWSQGVWRGTTTMSQQRETNPKKMVWLVKIAGGPFNPALRVEATVTGEWPKLTAPAVVPSPKLQAALAKNKAEQDNADKASMQTQDNTGSWFDATLWFAILGAFAGGLILNLMPCVLPILAIKLLSFTPKGAVDANTSVAMVCIEPTGTAVVQSEAKLSFRSASGLFAFGVVASFVLLGAVLLGVRAAGQSLGWGFQLQSPHMVVGLTVLFLLVGLNLFDAFELRVLLPDRLANFKSNNPSIEALSSGVLAVLVASPCTAPFMGASLGLAITLSAGQALLIFAALGFGMALPFTLIALVPSIGAFLLRVLPKPGAWMLTLRHFLAWPVFATVLWLLWVYAQQSGINSAFVVMLSLLMITALIWALRLPNGWVRLTLAAVFVLGLGGSAYLWSNQPQEASNAAAKILPSATAIGPTTSATAQTTASDWQTWSAQVQREALATGRPVFVDFTAAWCITCQVNKTTTLGRPEVLNSFKQKEVLMLRADWTRPNPSIAAELNLLGRTGLPVYAMYRPGDKAPQLLPEILTPAIVQAALSQL